MIGLFADKYLTRSKLQLPHTADKTVYFRLFFARIMPTKWWLGF